MTGINSTTPNVYVDKYVNKKFASNITDKYAKLSEQYGVKDVDSIIILSNADADKIAELTVKEYLKNYNIIKLEEIEYVRESDNKKWHFYDIIAQKKVCDKHE